MLKTLTQLVRESLASLGRHILTFVPGLVVWMESQGLVASGAEATEMSRSLDTMVQATLSVLTVVAVRLLMRVTGRWFGPAAKKISSAMVGALMTQALPWLVGGLAMATLSSCEGVSLGAVRGELTIQDPMSGAKGGISATPDGELEIFGRYLSADGTMSTDVYIPIVIERTSGK